MHLLVRAKGVLLGQELLEQRQCLRARSRGVTQRSDATLPGARGLADPAAEPTAAHASSSVHAVRSIFAIPASRVRRHEVREVTVAFVLGEHSKPMRASKSPHLPPGRAWPETDPTPSRPSVVG
jgi:hypothetical protein